MQYTSHVALARATNKADTKDLKSLTTQIKNSNHIF
jgi:hypothetical protein